MTCTIPPRHATGSNAATAMQEPKAYVTSEPGPSFIMAQSEMLTACMPPERRWPLVLFTFFTHVLFRWPIHPSSAAPASSGWRGRLGKDTFEIKNQADPTVAKNCSAGNPLNPLEHRAQTLDPDL